MRQRERERHGKAVRGFIHRIPLNISKATIRKDVLLVACVKTKRGEEFYSE
jgi:hypothetical protein